MFFLSGLLEGNPAWYWRLQREGNTQEHMGAQARIQTLPRGGKDGWITLQVLRRYSHIPSQNASQVEDFYLILEKKHDEIGDEIFWARTPNHLMVVCHIFSSPLRKKRLPMFEFIYPIYHLSRESGQYLVSWCTESVPDDETRLAWCVSPINILYFIFLLILLE